MFEIVNLLPSEVGPIEENDDTRCSLREALPTDNEPDESAGVAKLLSA